MNRLATFSIGWVNGGQVFEVSSSSPSPRARQAALTTKAHVLKRELEGTRNLPDVVVREMMKSLDSVILVEMTNVLVYDVLCREDASVRKLSMDEVRAKLTEDEFVALFEALMYVPKPTEDDVPVADVDPLTGSTLSTKHNA